VSEQFLTRSKSRDDFLRQVKARAHAAQVFFGSPLLSGLNPFAFLRAIRNPIPSARVAFAFCATLYRQQTDLAAAFLELNRACVFEIDVAAAHAVRHSPHAPRSGLMIDESLRLGFA